MGGRLTLCRVLIAFNVSFASIMPIAASGGKEEAERCIVAAEEFIVDGGRESKNEEANACRTLLPALILEGLSSNMERKTDREARVKSKIWPLRQERIALFMKMDNAIKARDGIVLLPLGRGARKRRIKAAEKTIKEVGKELLENMKEVRKIEEGEEEKDKRIALDTPPSFIPISIYNDGDKVLWESGVSFAYDKDDLYTSAKYAAAAVNADIDILITGSVSIREGFLSAAVSVYVYPLAKKAGSVSDVGEINDVPRLARRLSDAIVPLVTNTLPATAVFYIEPEEAAKTISISIDDNVQQEGIMETTLSAGLHTLTFTSVGYRPVSATYSFTGGIRHKVEVSMKEKTDERLYLRFILSDKEEGKEGGEREKNGILSNAVMQTPINDQYTDSQIKIDGTSILGAVLRDGEEIVQFYVPDILVQDEATLKVKATVLDRTEYIDKRRRWFYASYSVFITSLIGAFYTAGRRNAINGYEKSSTVNKWRTASNITAGVSCACGAWMIYELVRYLRAASRVIPPEAKSADYFPSFTSDINSSEESIQTPESNGTLSSGGEGDKASSNE